MRHERRLAERTIAETAAEVVDESANVRLRGEIARLRMKPGPRSMIEATLDDGTATARLVWFNAGWMRDKLHPGDRGVAEGRAKMRQGYLELGNPRWTPEARAGEAPDAGADDLRPIYPASEEIGSAEIEAIVAKAIDGVCAGMEDPLPESYRRERDLMPLAAAWKAMHAPQDRDQLARARRRLAFDEFLLLQLGVMMRRAQLRARTRAVALPLDASIDAHIRSRIPFTLTGEQDRVVGELAHDLAEPAAMNRRQVGGNDGHVSANWRTLWTLH